MGTKDGWTNVPDKYFDDIYKFFYSDYKVLDTLKNVPKTRNLL